MSIVLVHGGVSGRAKPRVRFPDAANVQGETALDLVEAAVRVLEDDPRLNAAHGAALNRDGQLELDAGIVDGHTGRVGAVTGVQVRNPISLARLVLQDTPHVLLAGEGAKALGAHMDQLTHTTEEEQVRWDEERRAGRLDLQSFGSSEHVDTVGAVALDDGGRLAAGSSTGGVLGKLPGRVGDAPIFGAGIYASRLAAVVGTGVGEAFIQELAAWRVADLIERGAHPQEACERSIRSIWERARVPAGLLALDGEGRRGAAYAGAAWAVEDPEGPMEAVRLRRPGAPAP